MRRMTSWLVALVAGGLVGAAPGAGAAPALSPEAVVRGACGNFETISLRTYHVVIKSDKEVYAVGETAKIHVKVTRPAHEDPLNLGIPIDPPVSEPAEGVNVGLGLRVGDVFLPGFGITDAKGEVDIGIKLPPYTPTGSATADGYAWQEQVKTTCLTIQENGYRQEPRLFKVVR